MRVLVAGATGNVGTELVPLLLTAGHDVRTLSRRASSGDHVVADVTDRSTLPPALEGVDAVFLAAPIPVIAAATRNVAAAAVDAGVARFVLLASAIVELGADDAVSQAHRDAEAALAAIGLDATVLRPGSFASNALLWVEHLRAGSPVPLIKPHRPLAPIDPLDIALVAVVALEGLAGPTCTLAGPVLTSGAEQVEILGDVIGRPLTWVEVPLPDDAAAHSVYRDDAPWTVPTDVVERLTGQPASTFRDWCVRNAGHFH